MSSVKVWDVEVVTWLWEIRTNIDAAPERKCFVRPTLERCDEMSDVLVGVDMGTGSSKAVVTNADGQILATATRPRPNSMSMPRPGWAEVNA